jgi:O-antigen ligase
MSDKLSRYFDKSILYLYIVLLFTFTFSIAIRNILIGLLFIFSIIKLIIYREFNIEKTEFDFYILIFIFLSLISSFASDNYSLALDRFVSPILRYLFFFYISSLIINNKEKVVQCFNVIIYGNITFAFLGILFKFFFEVDYFSGNGTGTVAAFNILIFTALLFKTNDNSKNKLLYLFGFSSFLYILFQTNSRGATLGFFASLSFFVGFLIYYNFKPGKIQYLITIILIFLVLITPFVLPNRLISKFDNLKDVYGHTSLKTRIVMWQASLYMIKNNPILGVGVGNYQPNYLEYIDSVSEVELPSNQRKHDHPHNMFLFIAAEQGIPSLLLFLIMVFIAIRISLFNIFNHKRFTLENLLGIILLSMIIVFMVHSMVDSTARYGHVGFYIIGILILNFRNYQEKSDKIEN